MGPQEQGFELKTVVEHLNLPGPHISYTNKDHRTSVQ